MRSEGSYNIERFWAVGINYRKTDAAIRGMFSVDPTQYSFLLKRASQFGVKDFFVLSTCNRTEIYGMSNSPENLTELLCSAGNGNRLIFDELAYRLSGNEAITHLFQVCAGLDSQLLGDYEITGQFRKAVKPSKEAGFIGPFTERLVNTALQAAKDIRTNTSLSGGTVSVSYATIKYLKHQVKNIVGKKILLVGTGKIGRNTCQNLKDYLGAQAVTVMNRTFETAAALASELGVGVAPFEEIESEVAKADIVIVSTNAASPIVTKQMVDGQTCKWLIDLSVPCNIEHVDYGPKVSLINVDALSKENDETLITRKAEVPKALAMIDEHIADLLQWNAQRAHVPFLNNIRQALREISNNTFYANSACYSDLSKSENQKIQAVLNKVAVKVKSSNYPKGCLYLEAINDYIS